MNMEEDEEEEEVGIIKKWRELREVYSKLTEDLLNKTCIIESMTSEAERLSCRVLELEEETVVQGKLLESLQTGKRDYARVQMEVEELRDRVKDLVLVVETQNSEITLLKEQHSTEIRESNEKHSKDLREIELRMENEIRGRDEIHRRVNDEISENYRKRVTESETEFFQLLSKKEAEISEVKSECDRRIRNLQEQMEKMQKRSFIPSPVKAHDNGSSEAETLLRQQMLNMQSHYETKIRKLEVELRSKSSEELHASSSSSIIPTPPKKARKSVTFDIPGKKFTFRPQGNSLKTKAKSDSKGNCSSENNGQQSTPKNQQQRTPQNPLSNYTPRATTTIPKRRQLYNDSHIPNEF